MKKEDAIKYLQQLYPNGGHCWLDEQRIEAIGMAIKALQGEPVSEFLNTESMIESYKQRLISQANGMKNSPLIDMCLASYKHGINETLDTLNLSNVERTIKNWKEPVSDELEKAAEQDVCEVLNCCSATGIPNDHIPSWVQDAMINEFIHGAKWQKEKEYTCYEEVFEDGAKWKVENLWKPADGDDLPEYEREVVVFTQNYPDDAGIMSVAIGHRPNPDGWDGKSLTTGKVEHYTPKTYGKGGWNIPDVKYWLDVDLQNMED